MPAQAALLVVDDNDDNRYTLTRHLNRSGYANLTTAADGREALVLLHQRPFDLVLLDIMMPGMNGYEVLEHLKNDPQLRHIPVIMISAVDEIESVIRCVELGADDYLSKPFNPTLLRARVGATLERKRLHDQVRAQAADLAMWNFTLEQRVADQVVEIERIGRMTVKVEDPQKRRWPVGIDRGIGKAVRQMKLTGVMPKPAEVFQTKRIA